ncbi:hypothetical protein JMF89_05515 [Clostridiaceae bacterium UIB06]|uniref:Uncharacterized protein n=1 Tax=Clostridium thailandense TaxID=2794346 RepID=A0A949U115_9CLOT|nr:hypothetical protein [Clostridium thailandense]MBV7275461.1 hypothetical protein [Clostridium thailandense]MCH5136678.1 hypothetical protein [Clostridiaceae bacterium UIB06]
MSKENEKLTKAELQDEQLDTVLGGAGTLKYAGNTYICSNETATSEDFRKCSSENMCKNHICPGYVYDNNHRRIEGLTQCNCCIYYSVN